MSENEKEELEQSLTGYKQKINHVSKASLTWDKELIFVGRTQEGYEIEFDAHVQWGCKPTDALLLSLAGCMGIDVVMFLQKMKMDLENFKVDITGERNHNASSVFQNSRHRSSSYGEKPESQKSRPCRFPVARKILLCLQFTKKRHGCESFV